MEWLPTESQPAEPRWVAVARAEQAQEEERQQAVAREAADREAAREVARPPCAEQKLSLHT
jgi:hypothetical protein